MTEGFSWENRRKWVARVLWGCGLGWGCEFIALFVPWVSAEKMSAVAIPLAGVTGSVIAAYIFGAAWENVRGPRP